jgi:ATP dependent DNA ligase C terminal region
LSSPISRQVLEAGDPRRQRQHCHHDGDVAEADQRAGVQRRRRTLGDDRRRTSNAAPAVSCQAVDTSTSTSNDREPHRHRHPTGQRETVPLRGLLLGGHDPDTGELIYLGTVGTGFTEADRKAMLARPEPLQRRTHPFATTRRGRTSCGRSGSNLRSSAKSSSDSSPAVPTDGMSTMAL